MRRILLAIAVWAALAGTAFVMEPLFPLGDWRWIVFTLIAAGIAWWLWRTDPKRQTESPPDDSASPEKPARNRALLDGLVEYMTVYAFALVPVGFIVLLVGAIALVAKIVNSFE